MKRILSLGLLACLLCSSAFAATPAKPYSDAVDGQVLTAAWLNGMFSTLYTWAQGANTDIAELQSGVVGSSEIVGTIASATASSTRAVVWTSTGLDYVAMTSSGTFAFDIDLVGANPTGTDLARFHFTGVMGNNASFSGFIGDPITESWYTNSVLNASITFPAVKQLRVTASSTASMAWKAKMVTHEINY
jgi:hypothetical protein